MGSLPREGHTKARESPEKGSAILHGQLQPLYASVAEMLQELTWETLATRRKTARLTFMYKLYHNLMDFSVEAYLKPNNERRTRGSHDFKFVKPWAKNDVFKFSFFPRTITEWNSLPKDTVNAIASFDSFKLS